MNYKLSPSDFTFLYEGCKCCYYLKVVHNLAQPSIPIPSIFSKIAGLLKRHYDGKRTEELHLSLPPGTVKYGEKYVRSEQIQIGGHPATCFINGRFDIVIEFDDRTYGVIDFKTGNPNAEYDALYGRQLHAYAYALEHPASRALSLSPISKMGLIYTPPSKINQPSIELLSYDAEVHWVEVEKDEQKFRNFLEEVLNLIESADIPMPSPNCQWCNYITRLKSIHTI